MCETGTAATDHNKPSKRQVLCFTLLLKIPSVMSTSKFLKYAKCLKMIQCRRVYHFIEWTLIMWHNRQAQDPSYCDWNILILFQMTDLSDGAEMKTQRRTRKAKSSYADQDVIRDNEWEWRKLLLLAFKSLISNQHKHFLTKQCILDLEPMIKG